ncbi:hypothetical protein [Paenibacillus senegalimassiliensis]|uniref:hypothetical protein n=1 Tax=Paenibacillus senegalimassiliensis TaxID=1737426 RepID=UPI00073EB904|nr:hypothetical protein [Paenibacillus senegalimassiliensis]
MRKTLLFLISCLLISISLTGCWGKSNVDSPQVSVPSTSVIGTGDLPDYDDFLKLMEDFKNNIAIDGFSLIPPVKTIFLIERDFTFDKKDTITLGGGSGDFNPTQQLFIFEKEDKSVQFYVRFSYTEIDMGNNLVAWEIPVGYENADAELLNRTDMATYTYRNLIVTITQNAKTKADNKTTKEVVKSVLKILDNYYSE